MLSFQLKLVNQLIVGTLAAAASCVAPAPSRRKRLAYESDLRNFTLPPPCTLQKCWDIYDDLIHSKYEFKLRFALIKF